jgi:hypothetical protein
MLNDKKCITVNKNITLSGLLQEEIFPHFVQKRRSL